MIGLVGQLVIFAVLAGTVGLGTAGWLAGLGYGVALWAALTLGMHRSGTAGLGPADRVTLFRSTLVGGVTILAGILLAERRRSAH